MGARAHEAELPNNAQQPLMGKDRPGQRRGQGLMPSAGKAPRACERGSNTAVFTLSFRDLFFCEWTQREEILTDHVKAALNHGGGEGGPVGGHLARVAPRRRVVHVAQSHPAGVRALLLQNRGKKPG